MESRNSTPFPRTPEERQLAQIWSEVLGVGPLDPGSDFFALGGASISAGQMLSRVHAETGVELTFADVFGAPRLGELAAMVGARRATAAPGVSDLAVDRARVAHEYPLTDAQQRMWFLEQLHPDRRTYRMLTVLRLDGALQRVALEGALAGLVARHGALRTTFHDRDGVPVQSVQPSGPVPLPVVDLGNLVPGQRGGELRRIALEEVGRPIDLRTGPLLRATLLRFATDEHVLLLVVHHLVFDARSRVVALRDLGELYRASVAATPPGLAPPGLDYVDFAVWQQSAPGKQGRERDRTYWMTQLGSEPAVLEVPPDHPRPTAPDFESTRVPVDFPPGFHRRLRDAASREGTTVASILLAAFAALLHRYTECEAMVLGLLVSGRRRPESELLVGLFVNQLALRLEVAATDTFRTLLSRTTRTMRDGLDHQDEPLDDLLRAVRAVRPMGSAPLFHVAFNYKPHRDQVLDFGGGVTATEVPFDSGASPFDITLEADVAGGELACHLDYARELFEPGRMLRMGRHFRTLLEGMLASPDCAVDDLPVLEAQERAELLRWGDGGQVGPVDRTIPEMLEEQVAADPDALALVGGGRSITYGDLNRHANRLAHHLRSLGVGRETIVGLLAERSPEAVVAIFAILKAGGAYVPLDPDHPRERVMGVIRDANVHVVVEARRAEWDQGLDGVEVVRLDDEGRAALIARERDANPLPVADPDSVAYVIYTSGSTGRPKGVLITHRSAVNMWLGFREAVFRFGPDRPLHVSLDASLSFDASVEQVLSLLGGHVLHIAPEDVRIAAASMVAYARRHALDVLDVVPTQMRLLLEAGLLDPRHHRPAFLLVGGESVDEATWRRLAGADGVESFNFYGPTECTVNATCVRMTGSQDPPHIGAPLANMKAYVLDRRGGLVPSGVAGELYLGGVGVARGYLNRPELTSERFVPDPFASRPGSRLYRSGDRARWVDGRLEFLGRSDGQVKLRGLRIELGEIDATLARHPGVLESATAVRGSGEAGQLVSFVVARDPARAPDPAELRRFLKASLPGYMVPGALLAIDALPRTSSRKVDHRALPLSMATGSVERATVSPGRPPSSAVGKRLYEIWGALLARRDIGIDDDFFDIGGHSLLAVRLMAEIEQAFGTKLPPSALIRAPTLERLTAILEERHPAPPSRIVALNGEGARSPLFLVAPFQGDALMFRDLARAMGQNRTIYSLQPPDVAGERFVATIETAAAEMVEWIEAVQPRGPYNLAGYCMGGQIAFEVATQLQARGRDVAFVGLLDTVRHGAPRARNRVVAAGSNGGAPVRPREEAIGTLAFGGRRMARALHQRSRKALVRATLEMCRRTGMRQPTFLRENEDLEMLIASLHRPTRFVGSLVLFGSDAPRAHDRRAEDWGWAGLATEGLRRVSVPGNHLAMLHPPEVQVLGERIAASIDETEAKRSASRVRVNEGA